MNIYQSKTPSAGMFFFFFCESAPSLPLYFGTPVKNIPPSAKLVEENPSAPSVFNNLLLYEALETYFYLFCAVCSERLGRTFCKKKQLFAPATSGGSF